MKIYFYPYASLRDRQLDTIRNWPSDKVVSPLVSEKRRGVQVSRTTQRSKLRKSWKSYMPLINIKLRSAKLPETDCLCLGCRGFHWKFYCRFGQLRP